MRLDCVRKSKSGSIDYEEFIAWTFGSCRDGDSDGEEEAMDKPSLVRMQSSAQYDSDPLSEPPSLLRNCSSCSGKHSVVSSEQLEASAVTIQRATRGRPKAKAKAKPKAKAEPKPKAEAKAEAKAKGSAKAKPATVEVKVAPAILQKGGMDLVCYLGGPVLITAPHSMRLMRGGGKERSRLHKRERYTAEITLTVARELALLGLPASLMVWNRIAGPGKGRLDPNYLLRSQSLGRQPHVTDRKPYRIYRPGSIGHIFLCLQGMLIY